MNPTRLRPRRGTALILVLVILAVVGTVVATTAAQVHTGRLAVERRANQLQAAWLARSGVELACARLLAAPAGYGGESVEPVPGGRVRIEVRPDGGGLRGFRVESEARYPADSSNVVLRRAACWVRRVADGGGVRLEVRPAADPAER